jgi:hypothetical protein
MSIDVGEEGYLPEVKVQGILQPLYFPLEIEQTSDKALLQFKCVRPSSLNLESFLENTLSAITMATRAIAKSAADALEESLADRIHTRIVTNREDPLDVFRDLIPDFKSSTEALENSLDTAVREQTPELEIGEVIMYMPPNLMIPDVLNYDNSSLGVSGAFAEGALQSGGSAIGAAAAGAAGAAASLISGILGSQSNNSSSITTAGAVAAQTMLGNDGIGGAVRGSTRITVNPNMRTLFNHVSVREFQFDFALIPRSLREAQEIVKIIEFFRTQAYPELLNEDVGGLDVPYGYEFPSAWDITAMYKDQELPGLDFQRAYLRNITTNYNPTQMGMFKSGHFNEIKLALAFVELHPMSREDIRKSYGRGDGGIRAGGSHAEFWDPENRYENLV